ncbi:MAG: S9 family peptidase [Chloroflexi bacterium]|nr:S9 family peptidase [Chloroflexota bacterium]
MMKMYLLLVSFFMIGMALSCGVVTAAPPLQSMEQYLNIGANSSPRIPESGSPLFFYSSMPGITQLFSLNEEGWPVQLTFFNDGVDEYEPSPDGTWVAVGASTGGDEQCRLYLLETQTGVIKPLCACPGRRFVDYAWSPDSRKIFYGSNRESAADFYLYSIDIETGEETPLLSQPGYFWVDDISADGLKMVYTLHKGNDEDELYLMDLKTKESKKLLLDEPSAKRDGVKFGPDGMLYFLSNNTDDGMLHMHRLDLNTDKAEILFKDSPWEVTEYEFSHDGKMLARIENREGYHELIITDIKTRKELPSPDLKGIAGSLNFDRNGRLVFDFQSAVWAPDIWSWDIGGRKLSRLTFAPYAGIDRDEFIQPELIRYKSFDGLEIPAFLYLPKDAKPGQVRNFIIHIHGGPESQFEPSFQRHFQYFLSRGYGILAPNVRGSTGYGRHYMNLDNYKNRENTFKDIEAAAKWLIKNKYTDPGRLVVKGGSYGGYMTLASLAWYPDLFAAGIDSVGMSNLVTFLQNTKEYRRKLREVEYGPLTDKEFLLSVSPITKVNDISAPLLIIHGENDPRVPVGEARQISEIIKKKGGTVELLVFPDEGHGTKKHGNVVMEYQKIADFLEEVLPKN